jgi:hypothetical protein
LRKYPNCNQQQQQSVTMFGLVRPPLTRALTRGFATRRKVNPFPLAREILDALPVYPEEPVPPSEDPAVFPNNPVTSAHCIDVEKQQLSTLDSVAVSPEGKIVHGRYGTLDDAATAIPLEYLALLHYAAEGAAALRVLHTKKTTGTVLVYGASQANGLAAAQLASTAGNTVVAVVGGEHSGNETMMECIKGLMAEPGTAVPEEYALSKKLFADLVAGISAGDEGIKASTPEQYLQEFKANFMDYVAAHPDSRPAAVSEDFLKFEYMEKDRETWDENMAAFLEQYPPGSPPVDKAKIDAFFSPEQYEIFRQKFWTQTSNVISGDESPFSAPHLVKQQSEAPEALDQRTYPGAGPYFPYAFSILNQSFPVESGIKAGGPILGAIIVATPTLHVSAAKVAAGKTLRQKAEALQFLSAREKAAFGAACSVAAVARQAGAPVVVVGGSLPGLESVTPTDIDVKEALAAMDIDDQGESRLNYFIQAYRANNFPFYANYAVHRASEALAGPRQIVVTR